MPVFPGHHILNRFDTRNVLDRPRPFGVRMCQDLPRKIGDGGVTEFAKRHGTCGVDNKTRRQSTNGKSPVFLCSNNVNRRISAETF